MFRIRNYSIIQKLTWMNMLVSGAALLLACASFMTCETVLYRQGMVRNLSVQAQIVGDNSVSALLFNDPQSAQKTLAALHAATHITSAWIYTPEGLAFAGYARDGNRQPPLIPKISSGTAEHYQFKQGILELVRPIAFHGQLAAYVYIQSDLGGLYDRLNAYGQISVAVLLASLLAALLVSWITRRVVATPIHNLSETARVVSRDKNYTVRAEPTGNRDEISELIGVFNGMLAQIQEREAEREELLKKEQSARTEAERASLLKDEFLATLSHELRTPLNAIVGWTHVLRSRGPKDEDLARGLAVVERNARAQSKLVEDMLDMSAIISGKTRLVVQRVELQDVVKAAVASVQHSADAKEIRLETILDPLASPVRGDPERLQQCLWNLLSNALKFTPKGGKVRVTLQRVGANVEVSVADSGEGISPEFLPHVFERFRQADASPTRRHGGLGLGLSIVKHLVELHGGKVWAQSGGESQGSSFIFELPMLFAGGGALATGDGHSGGAVQEDGSSDQRSLEGICVLAVDDDFDARDLMKHILESSGARVVLASSSRDGLKLVSTERPDVIISDIGMPEEDGYEFIRKVRALSPNDGGSTPAVALTAFAREEDRERALEAGYQAHIAKPLSPPDLKSMVASLAKAATRARRSTKSTSSAG